MYRLRKSQDKLESEVSCELVENDPFQQVVDHYSIVDTETYKTMNRRSKSPVRRTALEDLIIRYKPVSKLLKDNWKLLKLPISQMSNYTKTESRNISPILR